MRKVKMGLLLLGLVGCYDAQRTNPFDPALTPAVELLTVTVDSTTGSATLEWTPYEGKQPFAEYRVLRQVHGLVAVDTLAHLTDVHQTSYQDTTLQPEVVYGYWVEVTNQGGFDVESGKQEGVVYALPSIELLRADFSSDTATAQLLWTQYRGPNFAGYEVRRKAPELEEKVVAELAGVSDTTYTDTFLDGNTEYTYHIVVRTEWEGVGVSSNTRSGIFYPFDQALLLPVIQGTEPQAVGLAVDEQDRLYVGMTLIAAAVTGGFSSRAMEKGIWVYMPGDNKLEHLFEDVLPSQQSPIRVVARHGRVYGSVGLENDTTLVWALDTEGQETWTEVVNTGGAFPIGLHLEEGGELVMVDEQGGFHSFPPDGQPGKPNPSFRRAMNSYKGFPLGQVVVGPGAGKDGFDWYFVLTLNMKKNRIIAFRRYPSGNFDPLDQQVFIDQGIGIERGQLLTPVAMAFDRQRKRLLILEDQGRVEVFDGRWEVAPRYITQWGRFGTGEGEFLVSSFISVALAVDSRSMIYIVDGSGRIQVFSPREENGQ